MIIQCYQFTNGVTGLPPTRTSIGSPQATGALRLRPALPRDLPALHAIALESLVHDEDSDTVVDLLWNATVEQPALRVVAEADCVPVGFALGSLRPANGTVPCRGHIDLLAVLPQYRGHGLGRALLEQLQDQLVAAGAARLVLRGNPPNYAWPGIDIRYTAAVCLAESSGYERSGEGLNMRVDLRQVSLDTEAQERRLADAGVEIRRAVPGDRDALAGWLRQWGGSWEAEALRALAHDAPRLHLAVRGAGGHARFVGFACHGVNRRAWFGPMGTEQSERGLGVGTVLLRRCLADQRAAGLREAQIGWTGPIQFYARAVGATLDRVFWTYAKDAR